MWVRMGGSFYNTDGIISVERKEDASIYYMVRFMDRNEAGFSEKQVKPLLEALEQLAEQGLNEDAGGDDRDTPHAVGVTPGHAPDTKS